MAFNPLGTFHKNNRLWMAAILMVCMVTFVFCTGRGDLGERIGGWFRKGTPFLKLDGSNYTLEDMSKLRDQRKLANAYMTKSAEFAFRKLTAAIMEISKKADGDKDQAKRKESLTMLQSLRMSLAERKARPQYFYGSLKLDDLVEFKLWQLEADRRGIHLDDDMIIRLYDEEMYRNYLFSQNAAAIMIDRDDLRQIEFETIRMVSSRGVSEQFIRRAIGE